MSKRKRKRKTTSTTVTTVTPATYSARLGAAVSARRVKLGLSVWQLADGCGVSIKSVYAWESGTRAIALDDLPRLAEALQTTVRKLLPEA